MHRRIEFVMLHTSICVCIWINVCSTFYHCKIKLHKCSENLRHINCESGSSINAISTKIPGCFKQPNINFEPCLLLTIRNCLMLYVLKTIWTSRINYQRLFFRTLHPLVYVNTCKTSRAMRIVISWYGYWQPRSVPSAIRCQHHITAMPTSVNDPHLTKNKPCL